jgi:hypothetical protein
MRLHEPKNSNSGMARTCWYGLGLLMIVQSLGRNVLAGFTFSAPEIDAGSLSAGLGLLAGGILILRARRRSK